LHLRIERDAQLAKLNSIPVPNSDLETTCQKPLAQAKPSRKCAYLSQWPSAQALVL
jgi:hypothetical protein